MPKSLARKRIWNKKYPICIELGQQDDFMSKAQTDKETCEEKPPAERELGGEDPKKLQCLWYVWDLFYWLFYLLIIDKFFLLFYIWNNKLQRL